MDFLGARTGSAGRSARRMPVAATNIDDRTPQGTVSRLGTLPGGIGRVVPETDGKGIFFVADGQLRRYPDSAPVNALESGGPVRLV